MANVRGASKTRARLSASSEALRVTRSLSLAHLRTLVREANWGHPQHKRRYLWLADERSLRRFGSKQLESEEEGRKGEIG
jgi:hypothetical protein